MKVFYVQNPIEHTSKVSYWNNYMKRKSASNPVRYLNTPKGADMIICAGGDGTLLKTIKEYRHLNIPIYGINAGTVGFLMNEGIDLNNQKMKTVEFQLMKVKITVHGEEKEYQAFNDVMIGGDMNSWIDFSVKEKDRIFGDFKGGGLILSTSAGSTGINRNNRGTILPLTEKLWSITGDKTNRKIDYVITPKKVKISTESRRPVSVWIDGANDVIENVTSIEVSKGDTVNVVFVEFKKLLRKRREV